MITKINAQQFRAMDVDLNSLIETISAGKAILFAGSGFARNAIALNNQEMRTAADLADGIGALGGFDSCQDLRYASEKFLRENESEKLISYLMDSFTVKKCLPHQTVVSSAPWRRIYTTNYDTCIEDSAKETGKRIDAVDLDDRPSDYLTSNNICVHLNGSLNNLNSESLSRGFKLSNSSYLSPDSFLSSSWHYPFKRDLEMCSAIIFVGYSLYDIEIQKILYENDELSAKTFFVTSPQITERERFTLAPFGQCIAIGVEEFATQLSEKLPGFLKETQLDPITSLVEYKLSNIDTVPRDADAEKFLFYGDLKDAHLERALSSYDGAPLLIRRHDINKALEAALSGHHIAILSDFGNGKTVFLRSLSFLLAKKGLPVYFVENDDLYNNHDLEILENSGKRTYLVIDGYDKQFDFLQHFSDISPVNITLILAARTPKHDIERDRLCTLKIFPDEFTIDELGDSEINNFIAILENIGHWDNGRVTLPHHEKFNQIKFKNKAQLQQSLFSILQAPQMLTRVNEITKGLCAKKSFKDTVFAISVLSALDFPLKPSMISEVAGNNEIYSSELRNNESFKNLFRLDRGIICSRSSVFSLTLIRHHFTPTYVVDEVLAIAKRMDNEASENKQHKNILKAILRFSGVESLFPERQRINNLVRYYEEVKRRINWLKQDPHFWLQYGMALLAYDDYEKSQRMINLAYEWAEKKRNYHTLHIDMIQSRLYMEMATKNTKPAESYKLFDKSIDLLRSISDDDAKFRYLEKIGPLFFACFNHYSKANKNNFVKKCELLNSELQAYIKISQPKGSSERRLNAIKDKLDEVILQGKKIIQDNNGECKA